VDAKVAALQATGTLNRRPQAVTDPLFRTGSFFDPRDLLQVRYEMVRRHLVEEEPVAVTAQVFGVSLPTAYQAHIAFKAYGLAGLLPKRRGRKLPDAIVLTKRRKPLLLTSALSPWVSLRARPARMAARRSASFLASSSLRHST
jgi:hypothetical protein